MKRFIQLLLALPIILRGATLIPIQVDSTTRVLASPTNAWTANSNLITSALGLGTAAHSDSGDFEPYDTDLAALAAISGVQGDILYYNGVSWVRLGAGSNGQLLTSGGPSANPSWTTVATGGGTVTAVSIASANGFSGSSSGGTTPALTIVAGDITPSKVNGNTITAGTGTLTLGSATLDIGPGGTLDTAAFYDANTFEQAGAVATHAGLTSGTHGITAAAATVLDDTTVANMVDTLGGASSTGTGGLVRSTSPSLTTPTLGVASATSINGTTIPTSKTLAVLQDAQTFSATNTFSASATTSGPGTYFSGAPVAGTSTTAFPLVKIGTGQDNNYVTTGTLLDINAPSGFTGNIIHARLNGASGTAFAFTSGGSVSFTGNMTGGSGSGYYLSSDAILTRKAAANWQLGAADAASPVAQTLSVQSVVAGTTDTAGAAFSINGSRSTGTAHGGDISFYTSRAGSTSTNTQNTLNKEFTIRGAGGVNFGSNANAPYFFTVSGPGSTYVANGAGLCLYSYATGNGDCGFIVTGNPVAATSSSTTRSVYMVRTFNPTSGTAPYNHLELAPTINQTGGASGITRGLHINPTLTAAADFRALEITAGNLVLPKTVTAAGTTGAQTIDKVTGSVNLAAGATSLVVTCSYATANSVIMLTVASNDTTTKSCAVVAAAGSFTIYPDAAPTAETRVNFLITN